MTGEFQLKKKIATAGKRLYERGLIAGTEGNISARVGKNTILATPSGVNKGFLDGESLSTVDIATGKVTSRAQPSSEIKMHLQVYRSRPDVGAVVHAHPPVATGFAVAGIDLAQCILPEVILAIGPVPLAPYGTPSTDEVPRMLLPHIHRAGAFLLANHGALTLGACLEEATDKMEMLEQFAKVLLVSRTLGNVNVLPKEEVERLSRIKEARDANAPGSRCEGCNYCDKGSGPAGTVARPVGDVELRKIVASTVREMLK